MYPKLSILVGLGALAINGIILWRRSADKLRSDHALNPAEMLVIFGGVAALIVVFAGLYMDAGGLRCTYSADCSVTVLDYFYFSAVTWATIGYGDVIPATEWARAIAAAEGIIGFFSMVLLTAVLIRAVGRRD